MNLIFRIHRRQIDRAKSFVAGLAAMATVLAVSCTAQMNSGEPDATGLQQSALEHKVRLRRLASQTVYASLPFVTKTVHLMNDQFDGNFAPGDVSLRGALVLTNNTSGPNAIQFAANLIGKTISLQNELVIEEDVTILGPGPDNLTITGVGSKRLFSVLEGFRNVPNVEFVGLKLTGANTADAGADNRLALAAPFSRAGNVLRHNGTPIGTVNANGGIGGTQLAVNSIQPRHEQSSNNVSGQSHFKSQTRPPKANPRGRYQSR